MLSVTNTIQIDDSEFDFSFARSGGPGRDLPPAHACRAPLLGHRSGARDRGQIGFAALRGGDIVGEHDVIFAGAGERIVLRHIATDRMLFARGAVRAAIWGQNRKPGEYSMLDVLGLTS